MDLKFLESVIIDYLIWVESYTVYVVWIHNIAHQAKKMLLRVWKDTKKMFNTKLWKEEIVYIAGNQLSINCILR